MTIKNFHNRMRLMITRETAVMGLGIHSSSDYDWTRPVWKDIIPVSALDTGELLDHIPQGVWSAPKPYHWLDFAERMQEKTDGLIVPWVKFLNNAEKGYELAQKIINEKIIEIDGYASTMFLHFMEISRYMGKKDIKEKLSLLKSVKRGFLGLLSKETKQKLGETQTDERPTEEDILNTRKFVSIVERIPRPIRGLWHP